MLRVPPLHNRAFYGECWGFIWQVLAIQQLSQNGTTWVGLFVYASVMLVNSFTAPGLVYVMRKYEHQRGRLGSQLQRIILLDAACGFFCKHEHRP